MGILFPYKNHDFQGSGEQGSVVMKFTQNYHLLSSIIIYYHLLSSIIPWLAIYSHLFLANYCHIPIYPMISYIFLYIPSIIIYYPIYCWYYS